MVDGVFDAYGRYYDLFYRDKDYAAEVGYIDGLLRRYGAGTSEVVEFGSGTGKHGALLAQRGYRVLGIERSAEMVSRAQVVPGFQSQLGDLRTVRIGRKFDAALALFHVISYQTTNADLTAAFTTAAEHLSRNGLFVFDVWYSPAVSAQRPEVRIKRLAEDGVEFIRLAEPVIHVNENRVDVNYTIIARDLQSHTCRTFSETHPMRHFSLPELDLLAASTGFARVCAEGFLSGAAPGEDTWGVCLVLRRL
jgi:SAM-dependent methyltransferase